jgi:CRP/FNR family transcriptional regulator
MLEGLSQLLSEEAVFSKFNSADLLALAKVATRKKYGKGEYIFLQDEVWPYVLYIERGKVAWSITSVDGKRHALFELGEGDVVWGHSFFDGLSMPADMEVLEPCTGYRWGRETINPFLSRNADALWELTRGLVRSMRRAREIIYGLSFFTSAQRLAKLILRRYPDCEGKPISRDLTLEEMASFIGASPALVSRLLHDFADRGMIRITRTEFEFVDRGKMKQFFDEGQGKPKRVV